MAVAYRCDRCGQIYDWYECCYNNKAINHMNYREREEMRQKHKNGEITFYDSPMCNFRANCLVLKSFEPINENMSTNQGVLSGDVEDADEGNNDLIMLCADCMTDFLTGMKTHNWITEA